MTGKHHTSSGRELRAVLGRMEHDLEIGSVGDGELTICATCTAGTQPCRTNPNYECKQKHLAETELFWLLQELMNESNGHPAACSMCGKILTTRGRETSVLRELCPSCRAKSVRIQRGDVQKGKRS